MPHSATVTAQTGPARQLTAVPLDDVQRVDFQLADKRLQIYLSNRSGNQVREFDLTSVTTITFTVTSGNYAIVVS